MATSLFTTWPAKTQEVNYAERVKTITASETLTHADDGKTIVFNIASGATITLPAAKGTGWKAKFVVHTSITSNAAVIQVANATDVMTGTAILFADAGDTTVSFNTASTSDTITMDGTTRGGLAGAHVTVEDIASGIFHVSVVSDASGTEATPFSAAVS